jgi:hypothetical protein
MRRIHEVEIEILGVDIAFVPLKALQHCIDLAGAVWTSSALDPCFVPAIRHSVASIMRNVFGQVHSVFESGRERPVPICMRLS